MKKTISAIAITIFTLVVSSCEDSFLDKRPYGILSADNFYRNQEEIWKGLIVSYARVSFSYGSWDTPRFEIGDMCSDDAHKGGESDNDQPHISDLAYFRALSNNRTLNTFWTRAYSGIYNNNIVITKAPSASYSDESLRRRHIGEAKFLRAFCYFQLARVFGGLPLINKPLEFDENLNIPRSTVEDTYDFIKKDLLEAAANLPSIKDMDMTTEWGRASRESALGYLARAALYFHDFEVARDAAWEVIDSKYFVLTPDYQDIFTQLDGPNKESVVEFLNQDTQGNGNGTALTIWYRSRNSQGYGFDCPTSDLANEFEPGDPRRLFTIIDHGDKFPGNGLDIEVQNHTGYITGELMHSRKMFLVKPLRSSRYANDAKNIKDLRYPDILLMYAEALLETGGDRQVVCDYINMVRERARNSRKYDIEAYGNTPDEKKANRVFQVDTIDIPDVTVEMDLTAAIRHERRVEFAMEYQRFYDLKRWGYDYALQRLIQARGDFGPVANNINPNKFAAYPIPQTEIDRTGGVIKQNVGW